MKTSFLDSPLAFLIPVLFFILGLLVLFALMAGAAQAATAQFTKCGQVFTNYSYTRLVITMPHTVECPNGNSVVGVTLNGNVDLDMDGESLVGAWYSSAGVGVKMTGENPRLLGLGRVRRFTRGILATGAQTRAIISGMVVTGQYSMGVVVAKGAAALVSGTTMIDVVNGYGMICNGDCTVSQSRIINMGKDGLFCNAATCGSYLNYFERINSQDIEVDNGGNLVVEYHSCPHDISLQRGSRAQLIEAPGCSINCLNDGTGTYTGTTNTCR